MKKKAILFLVILLCNGCVEKSPAFPIEQDHCFMYARQQLDEARKKNYDTLYEGLMEMNDEIKLNEGKEEDITEIYNAIVIDHPEMFWIRKEALESVYTELRGIFTVVKPRYEFTKEEAAVYQAQVEEKTQEILAGISLDATDYEKVKFVYDYIIDATTYKLVSENNQNILSVLLNSKSVCAGYAKTMQYLLTQVGVDCHYLSGVAKKSNVGHAWNMIVMDGEYYYVDVTSGDPIAEDGGNHKTYAFLGMTSTEMERLYTVDSSYEQTFAITNNYFVKTGMYMETINSQQIVGLLQEAVNVDRTLHIKCSDDLYESYKQHMLENGQIYNYLQQIGLYIRSVKYSEYEDVNVLNIEF